MSTTTRAVRCDQHQHGPQAPPGQCTDRAGIAHLFNVLSRLAASRLCGSGLPLYTARNKPTAAPGVAGPPCCLNICKGHVAAHRSYGGRAGSGSSLSTLAKSGCVVLPRWPHIWNRPSTSRISTESATQNSITSRKPAIRPRWPLGSGPSSACAYGGMKTSGL